MFERYLTDALTTHFGHVVENLDSEKIRVSAWNGELVLKDLSLRADALESFVSDCPLEIAYGRVGNLELSIPWNLIRSQLRWRKESGPRISQNGCSITLTDVIIVITPRRQVSGTTNSDAEEPLPLMQQRLQKERQVQSLLDADLLQRVTESTVTSGRWIWVQDLLSSLLSTLSVTVRNIQIRYEDPGTTMGFVWNNKSPGNIQRYRPAFAVGITLMQFSVQTDSDVDDIDNSHPNPKDATIRSDLQIRQKVASAEQLAIYWDSNCRLVSHSVVGDIADDLVESILRKSQHSYLLDPVSPTVKIELVPTSKRVNIDSALTAADSDDNSTDSMSQPPNVAISPPSSIRLALPPCKLKISRSTLEDIAYVRRSLSVWKHATKGIMSEASLRRLAKLRPEEPPLVDPRGWWFYAFEASLALERVNKEGRDLNFLEFYRKRRRGWMGLVQALRRRKRYIELYTEFLTLKNKTDHEERHESLLAMEDNLLPEEIVKFRFALFSSLPPESFESTNTNDSSRRVSQGLRLEGDSISSNLSADQRFLMVEEMMMAIQRERSNALHRDRASAKWSSMEWTEDEGTDPSEIPVWKASVVCPEFSLQIDDDTHGYKNLAPSSGHVVPVIRLSTAWIHNQTWFDNGSWSLDCSFASFAVKDLASSSTNNSTSKKFFSNLIGPKLGSGEAFVVIDGVRFDKSIAISIRKELSWRSLQGKMFDDFSDRGSTTTSQIRILPMEVVYSTLPVEALSRVLATIKTPELVDDYHRMASAAHRWRERQKQKFLQALAHKNKRIFIDVDVGAPELLIPEDINRRDAPMLAINLGRLQMSNDSSENKSRDFDDQWRLALSDIQVRSTTASRYYANDQKDGYINIETPHSKTNATNLTGQLVEPFSLDFIISTRIVNNESHESQAPTKVRVSATLPRLSFNLSSSALRLVSRLKTQWGHRKREMEPRSGYFEQRRQVVQTQQHNLRRVTDLRGPKLDAHTESVSNSSRIFHFQFSAPIVTLRLENDVDHMSMTGGSGPFRIVPLVDLAFQGIHGQITQDISVTGEATLTFGASLHSFGALDLYQQAGKNFALLVSSIPQHLVTQKLSSENDWSWSDFYADETPQVEDATSRKNDLVTIEYKSQTSEYSQTSDCRRHSSPIDKLSVFFHELFVEWNPETLAAIQKAVRTPQGEISFALNHSVKVEDSDDEFFDALDDEFFDAASEANSYHLLSEISSASLDDEPSQLVVGLSESPFMTPTLGMGLQKGLVLASASQVSPSKFSESATSPMAMSMHSAAECTQSYDTSEKPFEVVFELSKLNVSFNKECRHRRVLMAEMDRTSISYLTNRSAGSKTLMSIGNLVFIDPSSASNTTLYGEILGLKSNEDHPESADGPSSLLEMEISINPKTKRFSRFSPNEMEINETQSVVIDRDHGIVNGCNNFLEARFSPMRFVFLEQLWFEIIDYFFEGVIGTEVWGGLSQLPSPQGEITGVDKLNGFQRCAKGMTGDRHLHGSDAVGVSFTRFDISLDTPEIFFPVTYTSPQFIRLRLAGIKVRNHYDGSVVPDARDSSTDETRMQWFNNCEIALKELRIYSWCGLELGQKPEDAKVYLRWPTGPLATSIKPKWNVRCSIDALDVHFRQSDYSLLQNIISFNIGEPSRHLDEWEALERLSSEKVERYNQGLAVHFGYDKKDVAPTTYDLTVSIPTVSFSFAEHEKASSTPLAVARCVDFVWEMKKGPDLILTQKATCDVDLVTPGASSEFEKMLSLAKYDSDISSEYDDPTDHITGVPELTYISTSRPSGDNVKTLEIVDACIYMVVPAWRKFTYFFQGLKPPTLFSRNEIASLVQVGDRWYRVGYGEQKIADHVARNVAGTSPNRELSSQSLLWIRAISDRDISIKPKETLLKCRGSSTFQMKLSLTRPRIILSSASIDSNVQRLILRMEKLEFLHTNNGKTHCVLRSFFLHDVEVYTSSRSKKLRVGIDQNKNSLIRPWSVIGVINKCNGEKIGDCDTHSISISGDVLEAHAAYSDMAIAVDVCLGVAYAARKNEGSTMNGYASSRASSTSVSDSVEPSLSDSTNCDYEISDDLCCKSPKNMLCCFELDGFELKVTDDSGRHFAGDQDLVVLSLGKVRFSKQDSSDGSSDMKLRLNSIDLFDCLQTKNSPFRFAASSRPGAMRLQRSRGQEFPSYNGPAANHRVHRKMSWEEFSSKPATEAGFLMSSALFDRTSLASDHCFSRDSIGAANQYSARELVEIKCLFSGAGLQEYDVKMRSFAVQWNPSTVIAIQRFLGRLRKESRIHKALYEFNQLPNELFSSPTVDGDLMSPEEISGSGGNYCIRGKFQIDRLTVCLNKEHQRRRLIELTLSGCQIHLDSSQSGHAIAVRLEDVSVWDSDSYEMGNSKEALIVRENRNVIKVLGHESNDVPGPMTDRTPFLEVHYTAFKMQDSSRRNQAVLPAWVDRQISEKAGEIDDFLNVRVAAFQFTYLRERTEEILDYLSNGLPGKGMGATSRAAQGFITKRILTKSFLELQITSPGVLIPQHESISDGMRLELGDVKIRSWFEQKTDGNSNSKAYSDTIGWFRVLSLELSDFRGGVSKRGTISSQASSSMTDPIDLKVVLRKPTQKGREVTISGALSNVAFTLQYTDYLILRAVTRDNLGRKIDKDRWDNVEKAYWLEEELDYGGKGGADVDEPSTLTTPGEKVAYASNARFIRYGKSRKREQEIAQNDTLALSPSSSSTSDGIQKGGSTLDLSFELGGLSLTLRRDDSVDGAEEPDGMAKAFHYDLMLLRVQLVEISLTANPSGDMSFHLSLFRIGLFDLGNRGRLMRENYLACLPSEQASRRKSMRKTLRRPCPFYVLAEGHSTNLQSSSDEEETSDGPQLVVSVDKCPASSAGAIGSSAQCDLPDESKVIIARVVINNLLINALIRPFKEVVNFISCEWPSSFGRTCLTHHEYTVNDTSATKIEASNKKLGRGIQVKLVAHYPRIFFLADECDLHSRALVLRGLAVLNLSKMQSFIPQNEKQVTAVDAQLVSMESYINPDVSEALRFRKRHQDMLGASVVAELPMPDEETSGDAEPVSSTGIALFQPVTLGLQFSEIKRQLFPNMRSVFINVEPVSTMLSFEDLELIESVLKRWSRKESKRKGSADSAKKAIVEGHSTDTYDVTFHSERLGLGLKTEGNCILVSSVQNADAHHDEIVIGDYLLSIDNEDFSKSPLSEVVKRLAKQVRPTTVRFGRHASANGAGENASPPRFDGENPNTYDSVPNDAKESEARQASGVVNSYTIKFRTGKAHGLELENTSSLYPVVTGVLPEFFEATAGSIDDTNAEQIEVSFVPIQDTLSSEDGIETLKAQESVDVHTPPRPGSVIVGLNDFSVDEIDPKELWDFLNYEISDGVADDPSLGAFYTLHFKEIDSTVWGNVDTLELSFAGINVTFTDDLNGRDMPLFRGAFNQAQMHAARGLGILSRIMDLEIPTLLKIDDYRETQRMEFFDSAKIQEINSEAIITFSGIARCNVFYFHNRIAYWEPLIEKSQLYLLCEKQTPSASRDRPGQLAVEISDRLLHEHNFQEGFLPTHPAGPQIVSFNITDASVDVFTRAFSQWKQWRQNIMDAKDLDFEDQTIQNTDDVSLASIALNGSLSECINETHTNQGFGMQLSFYEGRERQGSPQPAATQKAAHAALVFAQKRGAETSRKGETAKPFILRNRTGVSIAFVQQQQQNDNEPSLRRDESEQATSRMSLVGEYSGLQGYRACDITELADHEDARFSMKLLPDQTSTGKDVIGIQGASNRVRNYEGRYPSLTVAIQAVAGVTLSPLVELQALVVGSELRYLTVRKESPEHTHYSIKMVWTVGIEDNRRVLTLSSAVQVASAGYNTPLEVGIRVKSLDRNESFVRDESSVLGVGISRDFVDNDRIQAIGIARPGKPFYLPVWVSLRFQSTEVHVRPMAEGSNSLCWGSSSVLRFGPSCDDNSSETSQMEIDDVVKWSWEESFPESGYIRCDSVSGSASPMWLSVCRYKEDQNKDGVVTDLDDVFNEVLSVTIDSGLTLRNMLPMSIEWEVAYSNDKDLITVDGSSFREETFSAEASSGILKSGDCTEVFAEIDAPLCLQARFKEPYGDNWSSWTALTCEQMESSPDDKRQEDQDAAVGILPTARQVNVQVTNDSFGVPLTLGVRILPKMTVPSIDDPTRSRIYGLEVILFAELWIRNITDLPLNFGCPSLQFHEAASGDGELAFTAENALMEIANLLEVGDKATGLRNDIFNEDFKSLPNQECNHALVEEVFEYVEIESSTVKRRWWASESYECYREKIIDVTEPKVGTWTWQDERWSVDCSGQAEASIGGWESCRSLLAGSGSFSGHRTFSASHVIRRRRFFRRRNGHFSSLRCAPSSKVLPGGDEKQRIPGSLLGGLQGFHQPVIDTFTKEKRKAIKKKKSKKRNQDIDGEQAEDDCLKIAIKCGDGKWSIPAKIPSLGTSHGVMRVLASRWLTLTKNADDSRSNHADFMNWSEGITASTGDTFPFPVTYRPACLSPQLFELCYTVSDVEGEWGEFSRVMTVSPRFLVRNDSKKFTIEVKQAGVSDSVALALLPGECKPFYWADFRLPGLASVRPFLSSRAEYAWTGGVDLVNLGMLPLRLRTRSPASPVETKIRSIRATIEVRPGTGGTGINIAFKEEDSEGEAALFRIENTSTFPVWVAQDGVLANPFTASPPSASRHNQEPSDLGEGGYSRSDGDLFRPNSKSTYALDVPYRQGKYAHRKEASNSELLHVRIALAPLSSRDGIETVKVIGLTKVGDTVRLNPSRLFNPITPDMRNRLQRTRVLAIIKTDGPTRVLSFCLTETPNPDVFAPAAASAISYMTGSKVSPEAQVHQTKQEGYVEEVRKAAIATLNKLDTEAIQSEDEAKRSALLLAPENISKPGKHEHQDHNSSDNQIYSFRAEFSGFLFSLIDSTPAEIAVVSLKNFNVLARWDSFQASDASLIVSIGWLQVDNHVPSAPFKVVVRPDTRCRLSTSQNDSGEASETSIKEESPLLVIGVNAMPSKHSSGSSGIVCLRSVTVAPRDLVIAVDLAFLVRLQHFFLGLASYFSKDKVSGDLLGDGSGTSVLYADQKRCIAFPCFEGREKAMERAAAFGAENQKVYFHGLTILPCNITLSVAPARALTSAQASLEGKEAAAIHQAVRKGDVLVGSKKVLLGVRVGRRNATPMAVVSGVLKSIVVDALLRLDGASLNFSGVSLRNHVSTGPQLTTYLLAHYLTSLRQNVPSLIGSLAAFGNPLGLIRGLGDGMSDFVIEPMKGLKKSVKELDPSFLVDGVARGTESLARHTVGGFADSASLLTETFSKNMAVLTLDRRYAQKRDRKRTLRLSSGVDVTLVGGVESGFIKLVQGFVDGVTGVVKAPIRGAEKRGIEGFAKGTLKGLLGLLVKPMIGISDAATDVMIGVKRTVEDSNAHQQNLALASNQFRPRRPMYGKDKVLRPYDFDDAAAATLMLRTRCAGENYLSHLDLGDRVALCSVNRIVLIGANGQEMFALKYKHVSSMEVQPIPLADGSNGWGIIILLNTPRRNGSDIEVISCKSKEAAMKLYSQIKRGTLL